MVRKICAISICCLLLATPISYAKVPNTDVVESYEKMLFEGGYKTVDDAVMDCEKHFKRDIELPLKLPPVAFSHAFGICGVDSEFHINDHLSIEYAGAGQTVNAKNHYVIDIRPVNQRLNEIMPKQEIVRTYKLEDGTEAVYGTLFRGNVNALVFERKGWQYLLWIDKRIEQQVPAEALVGIANSIGLGTKYKQKPQNELLR